MIVDSVDSVGGDDDPFANLETWSPETKALDDRYIQPLYRKYLPAKMPWLWLTRADELGGSALAVGLISLRNWAMTAPNGWPNRVGLESGKEMAVGRSAVRDGLKRLADGGLIEVESLAGRKAVVRVLDDPTPAPVDSKPLFINHKIPWPWICRAAQAPTPALILGLAAWRYEFMTREIGVSRFKIEPLAGSNRTTSAIRRGLAALQAAGLVELLDAPRGFARLRIVKNVSEITLKGAENGND